MKSSAVLIVLLIAGCEAPLSETKSLGTLERDRIELTADTHEPIKVIFVTEGDLVEVGQALLAQNTERVDAALARAKADESAALAALAEAERGPRTQEISQARSRLAAAVSASATALHEMQRQKSLIERNFSSASTLSIMQGRYDEAVARADEARAALDELLEGTRNEKIDQARSQYSAASAVVRDLSITLERATIKSPINGMVEVMPFELGERPALGSTVIAILANAPTYARVHIPEVLRTRILPGTKAVVRVDGFVDPFPAVVRWVAADASFTPYFALSQYDRTRLSFLAEVDLLQDTNRQLPIGIPVEVTFPAITP